VCGAGIHERAGREGGRYHFAEKRVDVSEVEVTLIREELGTIVRDTRYTVGPRIRAIKKVLLKFQHGAMPPGKFRPR
jgi:hypothetical protein